MALDEVNSTCLLSPAQRDVSVAGETAVFSADANGVATRIARTDITHCRATEAEGFVANAGAADEFLRSFVVLQGAPAEEELIGTLAAASGGATGEYTLTPTSPGTDQCVIVADTTKITQIETVNGTATVTQLAAVPLGVEVSVIGTTRDVNNCLAATEVIRDI